MAGEADPTRWLDEHGDALYAFALRRLGAPEDAEDAVQECLLAALSAAGFEGRSRERTWLTGILKHKVLDRLRHRYRDARHARALADMLAAETDEFENGFWREHQDPWPGAGKMPAERAEFRAILAREIDRLPDAMRTALVLRELDGLGTQEICEVLSVTPTNLWTLVHRAKARLRTRLGEHLRDAGDAHQP
ncbi:MAG: sigma-70 family RNA polymerase sigma factor [Planctomycetota bacterium]